MVAHKDNRVSTHSRLKAAGSIHSVRSIRRFSFQHTAARRRLGKPAAPAASATGFQHTAARRRLDFLACIIIKVVEFQHTAARRRLGKPAAPAASATGFQHTAARRRLDFLACIIIKVVEFQHTAARRRLAAHLPMQLERIFVSTHSRPKAAGLKCTDCDTRFPVSTHSRPKAAGYSILRQSA